MFTLKTKNARREFLPPHRGRAGGVRAASPGGTRAKSLPLRSGATGLLDPLIGNPANSQSLNPYSYVGNNPLSGVDPTILLNVVQKVLEGRFAVRTVRKFLQDALLFFIIGLVFGILLLTPTAVYSFIAGTHLLRSLQVENLRKGTDAKLWVCSTHVPNVFLFVGTQAIHGVIAFFIFVRDQAEVEHRLQVSINAVDSSGRWDITRVYVCEGE